MSIFIISCYINFYIGIDILQNIIDLIRESYESQQRIKSYDKEELLKRWRSHSKWLVAQEVNVFIIILFIELIIIVQVMEFIIIPPVKPNKDDNDKEDLYFESPNSKSVRKRSVRYNIIIHSQ